MTEQTGPQPGDIMGEAFRRLQAGGPPGGSDFKGAIDAVLGESKPDVTAADAFRGPRAGEAEDALQRDQVAERVRRGMQGGISRIFERVSGGVKLRAKEAFHLTSTIVSGAANVKVFGQKLTTNVIHSALEHKAEIVFGAVAGGVAKLAARTALVGTGGFLAAAVAGGLAGAASGGVKEYVKHRKDKDIDIIDGAEKTLIIAGLKNEFRRIQRVNKKDIGKAALKGAIIGAVGGVIGVGITEFVANNEWVQEQISRIRLPEIKLPEVKLPQFEGTAPSVPGGFAPDFPAPESPPVAEATRVATPGPVATPPATVEAPAAASTAVSTPEATSKPTVSPVGTPIPTETPTPAPTGTPTPEAVPGPAPAIKPPPAPELAPAKPPAPPVPPGTGPAAVFQPEAPAPLAELATLPEQVPLPAGSNPWEVTSRTLRDVLGRDPTNAEILQVTKEVCRQSNISVPNWEITGEIDHRRLPVNYKLVFNDPVKKLIAGMRG